MSQITKLTSTVKMLYDLNNRAFHEQVRIFEVKVAMDDLSVA